MAKPRDVISDLIAEGNDIDGLLVNLDAEQWALPTPAPGWTIQHQVAHLTATFGLAALAATDAAAFKHLVDNLSDDFDANVAAAMSSHLIDPPELLARFRIVREQSAKALAAVPDGQLVPWLVRSIPARVLAGAGMMELFGHGQDIADALGVARGYTDRIGHLCFFAVRVWDFGYIARELSIPDIELGFELTAPSGALWKFGPSDAAQKIAGPAVDFCLLVTRRRHRDDLRLAGVGPDADAWLDIAQAYRGSAGEGRRPGQFTTATSA